jgi:putative transposase
MIKAYKYRIYPTEKQAILIDKTIGVCRLVYNLGLEIRMYAWKTQNRSVSAYDLCSQLKDLRKDFPWVAEVDSQALQASLLHLDKAYRMFFKGGGYPNFKSKKQGSQCYKVRGGTRKIDWDTSMLSIPKIKNIPIVLSRKFEGEIKIISISKTRTNKYFASIVVDNKLSQPIKPPTDYSKSIGIDVGINSYIVTSTGNKFAPNLKLRASLDRLKCLQARASKKTKGSKNLRKANFKIAAIHEKIRNQRHDYIHKCTTALIRDSQTESFVIESLNVKGMVKNKTLARAISDVSFGEFFRQMQYKCDWAGKNLMRIDQFAPSSKKCSSCGKVNMELTLDDRNWNCANCGENHDRDINAAKNIRWYGFNEFKSPEDIRVEPVESQ